MNESFEQAIELAQKILELSVKLYKEDLPFQVDSHGIFLEADTASEAKAVLDNMPHGLDKWIPPKQQVLINDFVCFIWKNQDWPLELRLWHTDETVGKDVGLHHHREEMAVVEINNSN